jgi:iron-sulfur cluster repair protein YtfE (RIC family)
MFQTSTPRLTPQAEAVLEDHRRLHGHLERIDAALCSPPPPEAAAGWFAALATALRELLPLLQARFEREEEGGFFERIQVAWPHTARACARLQGEHGTLLARFQRLQADAEAGPLAAEAFPVFVGRARSLSKDLSRHEELENELLFRSLDDAIAAQD